MLYFHFHSVQYIFGIPLRLPLWFVDYLEVFYLISKCLEIFLLYFCYWFLVWFHCSQRTTLHYFIYFQFTEFRKKMIYLGTCSKVVIVVQLLSRVQLFVTPWTAALQASLSSTISWSLLTFMSIELVMLYNRLILCCPLLLLPSIFSSIRIYRWLVYIFANKVRKKVDKNNSII